MRKGHRLRQEGHREMSLSAQSSGRVPLSPHYALSSIPRSLAGLVRQHELLWHMIVRHLKAQYKQSLLGYAWILLNPLAQLLTLGFIFSVVFHTPSQGAPFLLFLAVGLLPWTFFLNAVMSGTDSVVASASLVTAVYFPREIIPVSAVLVRVVDLVAGLVIVGSLMLFFGQPGSWTLLWVPVILLIHIVFVVGLALPLAALNLFFHDIRFLVGVMLNLWFFLTPIFYSVEIVPARYRLLYDLNPNARFIGAYRYSVLSHVSPPIGSLLVAVLISAATFVAGYYLFKKMEPAFADRV